MGHELSQSTLQSIRSGNVGVFEDLVLAYEKEIYSHLYRLVGRREDAEDLTQEAFIRAYKNRLHIDPEKNVRAWLYRIATNAAYDWLRRKRRLPEVTLEEADAAETIGADETYYQVEAAADLDRALEKLAPIHRTVLLLFYREGQSYEEIAATLNLPLNTVKTHLRRAKIALRGAFVRHYG